MRDLSKDQITMQMATLLKQSIVKATNSQLKNLMGPRHFDARVD